jgi:hypothetical protein
MNRSAVLVLVAAGLLMALSGHQASAECGTLVTTWCLGASSQVGNCACHPNEGNPTCDPKKYYYADTWTFDSGTQKLTQEIARCYRAFICSPPSKCNYTLPDQGCTETEQFSDVSAWVWRKTGSTCP